MHGAIVAEHGGSRWIPRRVPITRLSGSAIRALSQVIVAERDVVRLNRLFLGEWKRINLFTVALIDYSFILKHNRI